MSRNYLLISLIFIFTSYNLLGQVAHIVECDNGENITSETSRRSITLKTSYFIPHIIPYNYEEDIIFRIIIDSGPGEPLSDIFLKIGLEFYPLEYIGENSEIGPSGSIYELAIPPVRVFERFIPSDVFRVFIGYLEIYENGERILRSNTFTQVWTPEIPEVPIHETANGIRYTDYVVNLPRDINRDNVSTNQYRRITNDFYTVFEDRFDFLSLVMIPRSGGPTLYLSVKNDVSNIGLSSYNFANSWGSQGRLQGVNIFALPEYYDGASSDYNHLIGHRWINYLQDTPYESSISHWPFCNHTNGVMGFSLGWGRGNFSNVLIPRNDGYAFISDTTSRPGKFFQDMDLYLMGLLPIDSVEDKLIFKADTFPEINSYYPPSAFTAYSKEDLINDMGRRIPDHMNSQKEFNIGTVLVSPEPLSDMELYFYDYFTRRAEATESMPIHYGFLKTTGNPFYVSTHGLANVYTNLLGCRGSQQTIQASICEGENYILNGENYSQAGIYRQTMNSNSGCDSTIVLELIVRETPIFDLGNDLEITTQDTVTIGIDTPSTTQDYTWNTGENTSSITIDANTLDIGEYEYILTVSNSSDCVISDTIRITVSQPTNLEKILNVSSLKVFPNPFTDQLFFDLEFKQNAQLEITIFNSLGQKIDRIYQGNITIGHHQFTWNPSILNLTPGIYLCRVRIDDQIIGRFLVLD